MMKATPQALAQGVKISWYIDSGPDPFLRGCLENRVWPLGDYRIA